MRPTTRWLLAALALVVALAATPRLHALWVGSLPLTDMAVAHGGDRRSVVLADGKAISAVVTRSENWCQCPGLAVIAHSTSGNADSLFVLTNALMRQFKAEAAREPGHKRCLTVTLEVGDGMKPPWAERETYRFAVWRRRTDDRWVFFSSSAAPDAREVRHLLRAAWPRTGTL